MAATSPLGSGPLAVEAAARLPTTVGRALLAAAHDATGGASQQALHGKAFGVIVEKGEGILPPATRVAVREARLADPAGNRLCLFQAAEYRRYPPWRI